MPNKLKKDVCHFWFDPGKRVTTWETDSISVIVQQTEYFWMSDTTKFAFHPIPSNIRASITDTDTDFFINKSELFYSGDYGAMYHGL